MCFCSLEADPLAYLPGSAHITNVWASEPLSGDQTTTRSCWPEGDPNVQGHGSLNVKTGEFRENEYIRLKQTTMGSMLRVDLLPY